MLTNFIHVLVLVINGPECSCDRAYLVLSTTGDLLYVLRFVELKGSDPKRNFMFEVTKSFKVYKCRIIIHYALGECPTHRR